MENILKGRLVQIKYLEGTQFLLRIPVSVVEKLGFEDATLTLKLHKNKLIVTK